MLLALLIWNALITVSLILLGWQYKKLTAKTGGKDLSKFLSIQELEQKIKKLQQDSRKYIQNVRLLRYNPFEEVGGDQSFILSLLDKGKNGIVISSLHSRNNTRWFAKKVKKGEGEEHELSKEERKTIN